MKACCWNPGELRMPARVRRSATTSDFTSKSKSLSVLRDGAKFTSKR